MFQHELLHVECVRAVNVLMGTYKTLDRISQSTGSDRPDLPCQEPAYLWQISSSRLRAQHQQSLWSVSRLHTATGQQYVASVCMQKCRVLHNRQMFVEFASRGTRAQSQYKRTRPRSNETCRTWSIPCTVHSTACYHTCVCSRNWMAIYLFNYRPNTV